MPRSKKERAYYSPRLLDALSGMMESPLTAVCAPSGAGKTSAVRAFFARAWKQPLRLLWYTSFGETPAAGWDRVCDLFEKVDGEAAEGMRSLGFPVRQTLSLLAEVVQDIQCAEETALVIDNAQLFGNLAPHELLGVLAMHQCDKLHIVVITQQPLDEMMRVVCTPGVLLIGASYFFFTEAEIAAYFRLNGVELTKRDRQNVMDHTQGWVAALRLQLQGYQQHGAVQKEAAIDRLMHAVVWAPLSQEERDFFIAFSETGHATLRQICVLSGCEQIPVYGRRLLDHHAFISYDAGDNSYVMQQILREYAQNRRRDLPEEEQRTLRARAGQVYAEAGMRFSALRCMLEAGAYEAMLELPLENADMAEYDTAEVVSLLGDILAACPPAMLEKYPWQLLHFAFEFSVRGEKELYKQTCTLLNTIFRRRDPKDAARRKELRGEYLFLRSFDAFNDLVKMNDAHKAALKALGGPSKAFDAQRYWIPGVPSILAPYWGAGTSLAAQIHLFEQNMPDYLALTNGQGSGAAELMQAEAHLHAGSLDASEIFCNKAAFLSGTQPQDATVYFGAQLTLGHIAILRGDAAGYFAAMGNIRGRAAVAPGKARHTAAELCIADLEMALGRLDGIPDWLNDEAEIHGRMGERSICYGMRLYAKLLLHRQDYKKLLGFAEPMLEAARRQNSMLLMIWYHIYLACAMQGTKAWDAAEAYLRTALELALPDRVYLPFAYNLEALNAIWARMILPAKQARQVARIKLMAKKIQAGTTKLQRAILAAQSGLTKRENEVVTLAKSGLTNKEIGKELSISPETVKTTLRNVFARYDIHSRRELHRLEEKLPRNG